MLRRFRHLLVVGLLSAICVGCPVLGEVPTVLNFQGRLSVDSLSFDGVGLFKFALVSRDGAQTYWQSGPDGNSDGQPDGSVSLAVTGGRYSVLLGDTNVSGMSAVPATVFTNNPIFLRVWFTDGASDFERLAPDHRVAAVGYAILAATVPDGSISAAKLAPGALIATNLTGSLLPTQLPDLDAAKITSGVLSPDRIPGLNASNITSGTLSSGRLPLLDAAQIGSGIFDAQRIPPLNASVITAGTLNPAVLPPLSANNITTGVLDPNRIPGLDASRIESGTLNPARLPGLSAAQVTAGVFDPARIPGLDGSQIVSGQLSPARLPPNVAFTDSHVASLSAEISSLSARVDALSSGAAALPGGATLVSSQANDPALLLTGFQVFMNVPAPAWVTSPSPDGLSARMEHAAIWSQPHGRMFAWGGQLGLNTYSAAGVLYEPSTDQWTPITGVGAPSARRGHTIVFDGTREAFVWGGFSESGYTNSGARFDLNFSAWTPISTTAAPAVREGHVAIWRAPAMMVWGGRNSGGPLGDGALYDGVSGNWVPLPTANAPSARFGATAVLAGNRIVVWGGTGTNGPVNTGAQLVFTAGSPLAPTWAGMTTASAPSARTGHAAVWTGSRMIVWGGRNGGTFFRDGGMFEPNTGTWTTVSSVDAPVARADAAVVWTGQEMLVFGGETSAGETATGGAYDPTTNRWRPLSSAGNPAARSGASAVWTGTELIIFGGESGDSAMAALQRLTPQPTWFFYRKL